MRNLARHLGRPRRGTILIVTMWILLVLAGLVLIMGRSVRVEGDRSANDLAATQAMAIEQGAVQYVLSCVDGLQGRVPDETATYCEAVPVGDGAFWILRPGGGSTGSAGGGLADADETVFTFGITDEASKVNLNSGSRDLIGRLPGISTELAAAIIDWRDADSEVTTGGAESEFYLMLPDPYECKNLPLETVEELFLIRGATADVLFGRDTNRNGVIDAAEAAGPVRGIVSSSGTRMDRGLINFVTVFSASNTATSTGGTSSGGSSSGGTSGGSASATPRTDVNTAQMSALANAFRDAVAADRLPGVLDRIRRERPFRSLLDLYFRADLTIEEFQKVVGRVTAGRPGPGLINVNTAPREVLLCLPGLEESDVAAILSRRTAADADLTTVAWVAQALSREKAQGIGASITTETYRFSADIVSVPAGARAFRRCRVVIDAGASPPKVIFRQNLTHLGWPLMPEILTALRAGMSLEQVVQETGTRTAL